VEYRGGWLVEDSGVDDVESHAVCARKKGSRVLRLVQALHISQTNDADVVS